MGDAFPVCSFSTTAQDRAAFSQRIRELVREVRGVFAFEVFRRNPGISLGLVTFDILCHVESNSDDLPHFSPAFTSAAIKCTHETPEKRLCYSIVVKPFHPEYPQATFHKPTPSEFRLDKSTTLPAS